MSAETAANDVRLSGFPRAFQPIMSMRRQGDKSHFATKPVAARDDIASKNQLKYIHHTG